VPNVEKKQSEKSFTTIVADIFIYFSKWKISISNQYKSTKM